MGVKKERLGGFESLRYLRGDNEAIKWGFKRKKKKKIAAEDDVKIT